MTIKLFIFKIIMNMKQTIEQMIKTLFITQNSSETIKTIIDNNVMDFDRLVILIFNDLDNIKEEEMLVFLSRSIGEICIKKKVLLDIENQLKNLSSNDELNSLKKKFIRKILVAIRKKFSHCLHDNP